MTVATRNDRTNLPTQFLIAYFEKYQLPPRRTLAHTLDRKNDEQQKGLKTYPRSFYKFIC